MEFGSRFNCKVLVDFSGSFAETRHGEVRFPEISTTILEKICQYFYWSLQYARLVVIQHDLSQIDICFWGMQSPSLT